MATNVTRWSPDTCACVLEYSWDDAVPSERRTHAPTRVVRACAEHQGHGDAASHHAAVHGENTMKNRAVAACHEAAGPRERADAAACRSARDAGGKACGSCLDCTTTFRFGADRSLTVAAPALGAAGRLAARAAVSRIHERASVE